MIRRVMVLSPVAFLFITITGCSSPPLAPTAAAAATADHAVTSPSGNAVAASAAANGRRFSGGVIYVTSQALYYDTFVARDPLPMEGPFQLVVNGTTAHGPGQPGYLGGRWWEDLNGNGVQDQADHFFLCPLLPPGRPTP